MSKTATCPKCQTVLRCPPDPNVNKLRCPKCQTVFSLGTVAGVPEESPPVVPVLQPAKPPAPTPPPLPPTLVPSVVPVEEVQISDTPPLVLPVEAPTPTNPETQQDAPTSAEAEEKPPEKVAWWKAHKTRGASYQPGIGVLGPDFFAFLPTKPEKNLVAESAWSLAGFVTLPKSPERFDVWLEEKNGAIPLPKLKEAIRRAVDGYGGHFWETKDVSQIEMINTFNPSAQYIYRVHGQDPGTSEKVRIHGLPRKDKLGGKAWLYAEGWPGGKPTKRSASPRPAIIIGSVLTLIAALPCFFAFRLLLAGLANVPTVSAAELMNSKKFPGCTGVSFTAKPDLATVQTVREKYQASDAFFLTVDDPKDLIVFSPPYKSFTEEWFAYRKLPRGSEQRRRAREKLERPRTFTGRVYDGEALPKTDNLPTTEIRRYAGMRFGSANMKQKRYFVIRHPAEDNFVNMAGFVVLTLIVGGLAVLCWIVAMIQLGRARRWKKMQAELST